MCKVVGRMTRIWNRSSASSRALQVAIARGNWRLHAHGPSGVWQAGGSHRLHFVSGVNDGPFERWALTFDGVSQEQDPLGTGRQA
jgi:hypothetical protein